MKRLLISFEGLPGGGKTTAIAKIVPILRADGYRVEVVDIEKTAHAETLRAIARKYPLGSPIRVLLFWVMRLEQAMAAENLLKNNDVVIADRYVGSTVAFDSFGNKVPIPVLAWLLEKVTLAPDRTFFLDAPIAVVRSRKANEANTMKSDEFARNVERGYQYLYRRHKWYRVNASRSKDAVAEECLGEIRRLLVNV